jgi:hypothetical protein
VQKGNCPNGLIVSQAWYEAAIHDLEDASLTQPRAKFAIEEESATSNDCRKTQIGDVLGTFIEHNHRRTLHSLGQG